MDVGYDISKINMHKRLIIVSFILGHILVTEAVFPRGPEGAACYGGIEMTQSRGTIRAPRFRKSEPQKKLCFWNITAPAKQVIFFRFSSFRIGMNEPKNDSRFSLLRVHNGQHWLLFYGAVPDRQGYVTSSNNLLVQLLHGGKRDLKRPVFVLHYLMFDATDNSTENEPVKRSVASVRSIDSGRDCNRHEFIELKDGEVYRIKVTSDQYLNNCDRTWRLKARPFRVIELHVETGSIEYGWLCAFDRLLVYGCSSHNCQAEPTDSCNLLSCLCGNITNRRIQSLGNKLNLRFQSDGTVVDVGFDITIRVFDAPEVVIDEPEAKILVPCGEHGISGAVPKITGGRPVLRPGSLPWQVELTYGTHHLCGGSLLSDSWVITAAHCVYGLGAPNSMVVKAGDRRRGDGDVTELEQRQHVRSVFVHCSYDPVTYDNDIALLELERPFTYTNQTMPVCLPHNRGVLEGDRCHISGWGDTVEGGDLSLDLMYGEVQVTTNADCTARFTSHGYSAAVTSNQVCAGGERTSYSRVDACQGDSGGPLTLRVPLHQPTFLMGVVSWGIGCARPDLAGVYTRVFKYLPWIRDITRGNVFQRDLQPDLHGSNSPNNPFPS